MLREQITPLRLKIKNIMQTGHLLLLSLGLATSKKGIGVIKLRRLPPFFRYMIPLLILLLIYFLVGCNTNEGEENIDTVIDKEEDEEILLDKETLLSQIPLLHLTVDDKETPEYGVLYMQYYEDIDSTKITDKKVYLDSIIFLDRHQSILVVTEEADFYFWEEKQIEKVGSEVKPWSIYSSPGQEHFLYLTDTDEENILYYKEIGAVDRRRIEQNTRQYELSPEGRMAAYIDEDDYLYLTEIDQVTERIASNVASFELVVQEEELAGILFWNLEGVMYLRDIDDVDNIRLEDTPSAHIKIPKMDPGEEVIFYLGNYDSNQNKGELYRFKEGTRKLIASDVLDYDISNEGERVFYLNEDRNLIVVDVLDDEREQIAKDIQTFALDKDALMYLDNYHNLYLVEDEDEEEREGVRVGSDTKEWVFTGREIVHLTKDDKLFHFSLDQEESEVISERVKEIFPVPLEELEYTVVSFINEKDQLYILLPGGETVRIEEDIKKYDKAWLAGTMVYKNTLSYQEDIVGIWEKVESDASQFLKFKEEGLMKEYYGGEQLGEKTPVAVNMETINTITLNLEDYEVSEFFITMLDSENIKINEDKYQKACQETLDESIRSEQERQEALEESIRREEERQEAINQAYEIAYSINYTYQEVAVDNSNVRDGPGLDNEVLGKVLKGESIYIYDYFVDHNDTRLWLKAEFYDITGYHRGNGWIAYSQLSHAQ